MIVDHTGRRRTYDKLAILLSFDADAESCKRNTISIGLSEYSRRSTLFESVLDIRIIKFFNIH